MQNQLASLLTIAVLIGGSVPAHAAPPEAGAVNVNVVNQPVHTQGENDSRSEIVNVFLSNSIASTRYTVPSGKRLVLEFYAFRVRGAAGAAGVRVELLMGDPNNFLVPFFVPGFSQGSNVSGGPDPEWMGAQSVHIVVPEGHDVTLQCDVSPPGTCHWDLSLHGHLVPALGAE